MDELNGSEHSLKPSPKELKCFLCLIVVLIAISFFLTSCTISTTLVHTEGQATDVVDETSTTSPDVSAPINIVP